MINGPHLEYIQANGVPQLTSLGRLLPAILTRTAAALPVTDQSRGFSSQ